MAVYSKSLTLVGNAIAAAFITQLTLPDGEIRAYQYVSATECYGTECVQPFTINRLQSVTNNRGYQIKLTYGDSRVNQTIHDYETGAWYQINSATGVNMAVDYCDPAANACTGMTQSWPTVSYTYSYGSYNVTQTTDQLGNITTYTQGGPDSTLAIRLPGSQSDDIVYTFVGAAWSVATATRNGRTWTYSYPTGTDLTTVVTDPQNRQSTYVFDATTRSIKSYTNTAGELTTYQNDANGRPTDITLPTQEHLKYQYDARGNVTEARQTSFPAGSPDLVALTASYDATCTTSTAKKCNKPNWTRDAAGNQTDYVYGTAHGNPTSITLPAQTNGIRPVTNYTYTAYKAYYKNLQGTIVAAPTSVYYLTSVAQCRQTSGCSATSAEQLRTDIGYGANNVANNRLPIQTTVRNGSGTLIATTNLGYDVIGNLVSVDGPLAGAVDQTVTRYDVLRRVIGIVGPDPDDSGSRLNIGVRTTYDSRGLPATVEIGNLPGQTDSAWASFVPAQSVVREFDADRRLTKVSLVASGTTYTVQQVSFDTLGRVDCRTTRMNPAYFGGALPSACTATSDSPSFGPDRIVKYGYDNADRVTSVTSGYGQSDAITDQAMTYFTGGRLNTLTDGKGNTTTYDYDPYGRPSHVYYPDPTNVGSSSMADYEQYGYDVRSLVTSVRRRSTDVINLPRDALGRITVKDVPGTPEDVYFSYDNQGRLLSALFGSATGTGVTQTYDGLGRMDTRTVFGRQLTYQYDLRGRRTRLTHPDGFFVTYGYSNVDELLSLTDSAGAAVATFVYEGYPARTSVSRPNGTSTSYVPDALGRLQQLTQDLSGTGSDLTETFTYNPAGQIASKTSNNDAAYTSLPSPSTTVALFDGQNQLTNFAGGSVADDANANVWTGVGSFAYTHDAIGQLRQASGGANAVLVDYDPTGMLRRVTVGNTTTDYLYDGGDLIAEYNGSTVLRRFVHGAGDDEPLVAYEGSGTANKTWLHEDERGSIIAASDASGVAASSVKYNPDGDAASLASPFGYTGQLYLPDLQLYYYKARMYSAKAGRFLQPDPISYNGGMNLYGYAANDPANLRDPTGLDRDCIPSDAVVCVGGTPENGCGFISCLRPSDWEAFRQGGWGVFAPEPLPGGCGVYLPGTNGCPGEQPQQHVVSSENRLCSWGNTFERGAQGIGVLSAGFEAGGTALLFRGLFTGNDKLIEGGLIGIEFGGQLALFGTSTQMVGGALQWAGGQDIVGAENLKSGAELTAAGGVMMFTGAYAARNITSNIISNLNEKMGWGLAGAGTDSFYHFVDSAEPHEGLCGQAH